MSFKVRTRRYGGKRGWDYEMRIPVTEHVMEVTRYDDGGITWRQGLVEFLGNLGIFFATIAVAVSIHPLFAVLWLFMSMVALCFFAEKLRFRFFVRRPATKITLFEGADIPPELIERFHRAKTEYQAVLDELDALPVKTKQLDSREI